MASKASVSQNSPVNAGGVAWLDRIGEVLAIDAGDGDRLAK